MTFALLFDLDGTLTHSDPIHLQAFNAVLARWSVRIDLARYNRFVLGQTNDRIFASLLPQVPATEYAALADEKEALFRRMAAGALEPLAGARRLIDEARARGWKTAVVTNAPRANAEAVLTGMGLLPLMQTVVCGADLPHGKPHPLPYRTALEQLDCTPRDAWAFEDSTTGVQAAVAAGLRTWGIRSSLTDAQLRAAGAHASLADFTDPLLWDALAQQPAPR